LNSKLLIDALVRQTTVLIAALSTAAGIRAPLAHVADQVFLDLARSIEAQGVGRKVVADMFGIALRTYQRKVQRLTESASERNRTLWEAVYEYVLQTGELSRLEIERHFRRDEPEDVGAVVHDLVASGLLRASTRDRDEAVYRAAGTSGASTNESDPEALAALVWVAIYRRIATTGASLAERLGVSAREIDESIARLIADGRVRATEQAELRADVFSVRVGDKQGWEAAVFDHFSAVAAAIASKVQRGPGSRADDRIGGATLSFDVHPGHPHESEVYGLLARIRGDVNELWTRVSSHNRANPIADDVKRKVTFYFGQNVQENDELAAGDDGGKHD
jgi:hypothetical protein